MSVLSKIRKIAALCCQTFLIASSFSKCKYFFTQRCSVEMSTKIKTLLIRSQWNQWLCYEFDINLCILLIVVIFFIYEYFNTVLITDLLLWPKPFSGCQKCLYALKCIIDDGWVNVYCSPEYMYVMFYHCVWTYMLNVDMCFCWLRIKSCECACLNSMDYLSIF